MKRLLLLILVLFLSVPVHPGPGAAFSGRSEVKLLLAQDFDDDDHSDDDEDEADPEKKEPEKEEEVKEPEKKDKKDDDDFQEDEEEKKEEERLRKEEEERERQAKEKEKQAALERDKKRKEENERLRKEAALAEERLREAKAKAEEQKRAKYSVIFADRERRRKYRESYLDYMAKNSVRSKMPSLTGIAWSVTVGFQPNTGNSSSEGFTFSDQVPFYLSNNVLATSLTLSAPGFPQNRGVAHVANLFSKQVYDINSSKSASIPDAVLEKSSGSISTIPIGGSVAWYQPWYLVRLGLNFHHSLIGIGGTNKFTFQFAGQNAYIEHKASLMRLELPLSLALRFLHSGAYGMYIGGGGTLFWGQNKSEIRSNDKITFSNGISGAFEPETDKYSAFAFGFHFLIGIEAELVSRTYLTVELFQHFGTSNFVEDSEIGARSLAVSGSKETDRPDKIKLNFTGTQILVGMRRFL